MSIDTELQAMRTHISNSYNAVQSKGGTIPQNQSFANLSTAINSIATMNPNNGIARYKLTDNRTTITPNDIPVTGLFNGAIKISGRYSENGTLKYAFSHTNMSGALVFPELTDINCSYGFDNAFAYTNITSATFSKLNFNYYGGSYFFSYAFAHCPYLTSVSFPEVTRIRSGTTFNYFCRDCVNLVSVDFSKLSEITGINNFFHAFDGCTSLTAISFPKLTIIDTNSSGNFSYAFAGCTSLSSVGFPLLDTINSANVFLYAFQNCTALTSISFPKLSTIPANVDPFSYYAFYDCTNLTEIHFKASIASTIQNLAGYSTKFGASNATIYFDL